MPPGPPTKLMQVRGSSWRIRGETWVRKAERGRNGQPCQPDQYEWGSWQACLIPQDKPFVSHTSLNVSWLEFIPLCTNSCPYSNLTVRIEVVNPFILVAFITCGCSKHMLQGASCYFIKKKKNSFLSCQSGFNHTRASVMAPSDHGLRRYAGARGPGLLPICSDPLSDEASSLPCTPVKKHPKERKGSFSWCHSTSEYKDTFCI